MVCSGYARTFALFCKHAGIECAYVSGTASGEGHAWNQVKVDGKWYNIDVTWDDPAYYNKPFDDNWGNCYSYFLVCDEHMKADHTPEVDTHACTATCYKDKAFEIEGSGTDIYGGASKDDVKQEIYETVWQALENNAASFEITFSRGLGKSFGLSAVTEALYMKNYSVNAYSCNSTATLAELTLGYDRSNVWCVEFPAFHTKAELDAYLEAEIAKGTRGEIRVYYKDSAMNIDFEALQQEYLMKGAYVGGTRDGSGYSDCIGGTIYIWDTFDVVTSEAEILAGMQNAWDTGCSEYKFLYDYRDTGMTYEEVKLQLMVLESNVTSIKLNGCSYGASWDGMCIYTIYFEH